jgi:hypothetical protein
VAAQGARYFWAKQKSRARDGICGCSIKGNICWLIGIGRRVCGELDLVTTSQHIFENVFSSSIFFENIFARKH